MQETQKNNKTPKPQVLKGFKDYLPQEMQLRNFVLGKIKQVFEQFGYLPLETPTLEYQSVLLGKYGEEADKLVYTFSDKGEREVGLKYDLTVPTARVLSVYRNELVLPFKRYQIQSVFRAEKPQRGRLREFLQCDVDNFGVKTPLSDAEIVAIIYRSLRNIGLTDFIIKINSRQVLFNILESFEFSKEKQFSILQALDKLEKIGQDGVLAEFSKKGIDVSIAKSILEKTQNAKPDEYLKEMLQLVTDFGVPEEYFAFDPSMVRGLDYYTGPIFETYVTKPKIGSVTGGGRYDNLIATLGGPDIPATGTTIGLDRICEVVKELGLFTTTTSPEDSALVITFEDCVSYGLEVVQKLQEKGISAQIYLNPKESLRGQLAYASKIGVAKVYIAGSKEKEKGIVVEKNMKTGKQEGIRL